MLRQPRNRGLGVELVSGVVAVGVGRNSIGAVVTSSRPYKKVIPLTNFQPSIFDLLERHVVRHADTAHSSSAVGCAVSTTGALGTFFLVPMLSGCLDSVAMGGAASSWGLHATASNRS